MYTRNTSLYTHLAWGGRVAVVVSFYCGDTRPSVCNVGVLDCMNCLLYVVLMRILDGLTSIGCLPLYNVCPPTALRGDKSSYDRRSYVTCKQPRYSPICELYPVHVGSVRSTASCCQTYYWVPITIMRVIRSLFSHGYVCLLCVGMRARSTSRSRSC